MLGIELTDPVVIGLGLAGATLLVFGAVAGTRRLVQMGQFSYTNARLSTLGNPYVRRDEVLPLADLNSPESLMKNISSDLISIDARSFREADRQITLSFHKVLDRTTRSSPDILAPLMEAFISRWVSEELKKLIRLVGRRNEPVYPVGWLTQELEVQILSSKDLVSAMELLEGQEVGKLVTPIIRSDGLDLADIDSAIERYSIEKFKNIGELPRYCRKGVNAFSDLLMDHYNINTILRGLTAGMQREEIRKGLITSGGIIGSSILEQMIDASGPKEAIQALSGTYIEPFFKDVQDVTSFGYGIALDRMLLDTTVGLSHSYATNIGPTLRYLIGLEMELRNLRTIVQGSFSRWDPERTRSMLILEGGAL